MQIANILLAIAGERGNTVPKYDVTPSEVAVLRLLHGDDAVTDIEITGEKKTTHKAERERLSEAFARKNENGHFVAPAVQQLFPGAAASLFDNFDDLDIPEDFYKAKSRMTPVAAKPKKAEKAEKTEKKAEAPAPAEPVEDDEDGGKEMADNGLFK
jgi:hypothetical protein